MTMDQLSQRESEVFELAARGLSNDEIAAALDISRRTVETHMRTVFHKTGVSRRSQLVALARSGTTPTDQPAGPAVEATAGPGRRTELYANALTRLVDRQFPLFEERVDITVLVGDRDGQDTVVERRRTVPKPYLVYRALRPIVTATGGPPDPAHLSLMCDVHGQDIQADLCPVIEEDGFPQVIALFQPGLSEPTEWTLRYRSPGLWDPLREDGTDILRWATATLDGRHRPTIDALTLTVVFPSGWADTALVERDGQGTVRMERDATGQTVATWRHRTQVTGEYNWELRGKAGG
jgi:DNA-binding CsgD family transcriptional regulator